MKCETGSRHWSSSPVVSVPPALRILPTERYTSAALLRKMHHVLRFDPIKRYERLLAFYEENKLPEEARWVKKRVGEIRKAK